MLFSLKMTRTNDTTSKSYILWWSNISQNSAIFWKFLRVFASFCKFLQVSASFCKNQDFVRFCTYLQNSARFFMILQVSAKFCKFLQDSTRFCKMLQDSARFFKIQQRTLRNPQSKLTSFCWWQIVKFLKWLQHNNTTIQQQMNSV